MMSEPKYRRFLFSLDDVTLTRSNYAKWKILVRIILKRGGLFDAVINGDKPAGGKAGSAEQKARELWEEQNEEALGVINCCELCNDCVLYCTRPKMHKIAAELRGQRSATFDLEHVQRRLKEEDVNRVRRSSQKEDSKCLFCGTSNHSAGTDVEVNILIRNKKSGKERGPGYNNKDSPAHLVKHSMTTLYRIGDGMDGGRRCYRPQKE